jgi:release factor glutamine methyltransferase
VAECVSSLIARAASRLAAAGVSSPDLDAERLLRHVTGWDRARVLAFPEEPVLPEHALRFEALVAERAKRVPLQHLVGTHAFWRHEFRVTQDVLIPRPETEILVEEALRRLKSLEAPRVVDVGTGSGAIALSLAAELPAAEVIATDLSPRALEVARENARRLGLDGRVSFLEGDLLAPVAGRRFDAVASNPPYVDAKEREALEPEVRDHDPALALFAPGDALSVYRRLAPQAREALVPGGLLLLEVGAGQAAPVSGLLRAEGLAVEAVVRDLAGIERTLVARRP